MEFRRAGGSVNMLVPDVVMFIMCWFDVSGITITVLEHFGNTLLQSSRGFL